MQTKPSATDAEFEFIEHRLRIRWGVVIVTSLNIGTWAVVAATHRDPVLSATCVVLSGLCYPALAFLSQLHDKVSGPQVDALKRRMDPRLSWRKRAIAQRS